MKKLFADTLDYQHNRPIQKSARYDAEVAYELSKMMKKYIAQMKDRTINEKSLIDNGLSAGL